MTTIPETMRALVLSGKGFEHLALKEIPVPRPGPKQLLARVDAAGVCTSLIKIVEQGAEHRHLAVVEGNAVSDLRRSSRMRREHDHRGTTPGPGPHRSEPSVLTFPAKLAALPVLRDA